MNIGQYFQEYDWEMLASPKKIFGEIVCDEETYAPTVIRNNISSLLIERDNKYNLRVTAQGNFNVGSLHNDFGNDKELRPSVGSIIHGGTIICKSDYDGFVTLKSSFYTGHSTSYRFDLQPQNSFEASFKTYEINWSMKRCRDDIKADALVEWYLNGISNTTLFCDSSSVRDTISRDFVRADVYKSSVKCKTEHFSRDCLYITYGNIGFLLRRLPDSIEPTWSNHLAIEYREVYGGIPDKKERERISELLSFLMGRHLILIGDTSYSNDSVLEFNMYHPHSKDAFAECASNTREIVPVHQYDNECNNFRICVEKLLPVYLNIRDKYGLNHVLERYWLANIMPVGVNLPILAGAIESLMKVWFKEKSSKTKGVYIDSKQYKAMLEPVHSLLEDVFQNCEYKDKILQKISNAYQMGVNERFFVFLTELGLEYSKAEKESLKARNSFTHGDNVSDYYETIQKTKTMFILLGRILLKFLGYEGEYIDETILGYPRKSFRITSDDKRHETHFLFLKLFFPNLF